MKRVFVHFILIIFCFIIQSTLLRGIQLGPVVPNLVLMIVSCFGFMRGKREGLLVGFFSGLLLDVFYGGGILGAYALIYMMVGYMNGFFNRIFYPEDIKLPIFFVGFSGIIYSSVIYVFMFLLRRRFDVFAYVKQVAIPEIVYTVLATLVLYRPVLYINSLLEEDERKTEVIFS